MSILRHNPAPDLHTPRPLRRFIAIAAGLVCGITLSMHSIHSHHPATSVIAESAPSTSRSVSSRPALHATARKRRAGWHQIGLASWYGPKFQGKETANGETFNMHDLTCAHRSLPLGTWIKVTDLRNRKWIVVRVNDRGPVPDTRIADLSSEAAYMLGMRARGVTRVRLDVIDPKAAVEIARLDRIRMARLAAEQPPPDAGN
ncbi:MAG: septal ring lytic transglycosylase RlpA family protein [Acidobacteriaceae bacterium]